MITAYCFQSNNHHVITAAIRMITGCKDTPTQPVVWHESQRIHEIAPLAIQQHIATSYHIAPPQDGWVIVYPNMPGKTPFASSLSRQARKYTVSIIDSKHEAWQGGHPVIYTDSIPFELLPTAYFYYTITPPQSNWQQWLHLWSPRWQPIGA